MLKRTMIDNCIVKQCLCTYTSQIVQRVASTKSQTMAQENSQKIELIQPAEGTTGPTLSTPKAADLNSPGRRIGTASDESPRMEQSADVKRYEQLLKICNQMKDKEAELNQKEEKLRTLNANKLELNRSLAELKDKASKEAPSAKNEHAQQIEQTINDKNTLIQVIENELTELAGDQKIRVSSDEAIISGYIKKITGIEGDIGKTQKQSSLATNKLLDLQTKALAVKQDGPPKNNELDALNETLQKRKAELTVAKDTGKELQGNLDVRSKGNEASSQQIEKLKGQQKDQIRQIQLLEQNLNKTKASSAVDARKKEIAQLTQKTQAELKSKLEAIKLAASVEGSAPNTSAPSAKVEELKVKLAETQKELDSLRASQFEDNQTVTSNIEEIQRRKEERKKQQQQEKNQHAQEETKIKELIKTVDNLKKEQKKLKQEEVELLRSNHVQELEDAKKKAHKRLGDTQALETLRITKHKLQKEVNQAKQRYAALEKSQKNHVPSQLIENYKKNVEEKKAELVIFNQLNDENTTLKSKINESLILKDKIEWEKNPRIDDLDKEIQMGKLRIEDVTQQNKDTIKRVAQATSKLNEYMKAYPDFQIPKKGKKGPEHKESKKEEQKSEKKDNGKSKVEAKVEVKQEPKAAEPKLATKGSKKNKKQNQEAQPEPIEIKYEYITIEEVIAEPVAAEPVAAAPPAGKKGKKKNKGGAEVHVEQQPRQQPVGSSSPDDSEKLAEIERKIIEEATKEIDEARAEEQNKRTSKKDKKKVKGAKDTNRRSSPEQTEEEFVGSLPTAKEEPQGGLKNLLLPAGLLAVLLGLVFLMLK